MVSFTLTYDKDILQAIADNIAAAPQTINVFAQKSIPKLMEKELKPLTTEPQLPDLPFIWSFDPVKQRKARRWYFKNKVPRGGGTGRHVRTHELVRRWKIVTGSFSKGTIISVSNDTPGLDFVQGPQQVPSHADSGWAQYDDVLLRAEQKANDTLIDVWFDVLVNGGTYT